MSPWKPTDWLEMKTVCPVLRKELPSAFEKMLGQKIFYVNNGATQKPRDLFSFFFLYFGGWGVLCFSLFTLES